MEFHYKQTLANLTRKKQIQKIALLLSGGKQIKTLHYLLDVVSLVRDFGHSRSCRKKQKHLQGYS